MRFVRLDLLAFGRFTDVRLNLGPGFHLIFGPNEAGKSTTLRAIRQLLFGFDERTNDNFLHQNPNLRIGGVVSNSSGIELEVVRRKTRKDSLLDAAQALAIDVTTWKELLCQIDEATFTSRYGIDYEQLRKGGQEIATGTGDLGEILFATGSGVAHLADIQKKLAENAADLFRPTGKKQRLNMALTELQEFRDQENQSLLLASEWEAVDNKRRHAVDQLSQITAKLASITAESEMCRRLQQAQSVVAELDTLANQATKRPPVPRLPSDFSTNRQQAELLLKNAETSQQSESASLAKIEKELEQIRIPQNLSDSSDELASLFSDWGSIRKAGIDRVGLVFQADRLKSEAKRLTDSLQLALGQSISNTVDIDRETRLRIAKLGRDQAGLLLSRQQAETQSKRLCELQVQKQSELDSIPAVEQSDDLRSRLQLLRSEGDLVAALQKLQSEIANLSDQRGASYSQLGPDVGPLETIRIMKVPEIDQVRQREKEFEKFRADRALLQSRLADLETAHARLDRQIADYRTRFQVPTEEELTDLRAKRDELLGQIRESVLASTLPPIASIDSLVQHVLATDQLSDRLRSEADRVAQLAEHQSELQLNENSQHELSIQLASLDAKRIEADKRWLERWPDLSKAPLVPQDLTLWLLARENLVRIDSAITLKEVEARRLDDRIREHTSSLGKLLDVSDQGSLRELLRIAEQKIEQINQHTANRRVLTESIRRLTVEIQETTTQLQANNKSIEEWSNEWQTIMSRIALPPETSTEVATTYLESISDLVGRQREIDQLQERIRGIDADATSFQVRFRSLCEQLAPDLLDLATSDAIAQLQTRFADLQKARTKSQELTIRKNHAEEQLAQAAQMRQQAIDSIEQLLRTAESPLLQDASIDDPGVLVNSLNELSVIDRTAREQQALDVQAEQLRKRLQELSADNEVEAFIQQVRHSPNEQLSATLLKLERQDAELSRERDSLNQQIGSCDTQLERMDGRDDTALMEERRTQCRAQIKSDAEEYVRLKLAGAALKTAIERYREKIRGPILKVAGDLFRELTLQSFEGLRVEEDERNRPVLVGIRQGGREFVPVEGMSEGTCDQLYLALRLASLQLEQPPRSHLPFVIDDVLIQFDDARSAAALQVLSRLAKQRQVIFFTHHEHLLEIAENFIPGQHAAHRLLVS